MFVQFGVLASFFMSYYCKDCSVFCVVLGNVGILIMSPTNTPQPLSENTEQASKVPKIVKLFGFVIFYLFGYLFVFL